MSSNDTTGSFNYQSNAVATSLRSTGSIYFDRDTTGRDSAPVGLDPTPVVVPVHDGRALPLTLDRNGCVLVPHAYEHVDYMNEEQIVNTYYTEACRLVKEMTGADKVVAFDHNVRHSEKKAPADKEGEAASGTQIKGGNAVQGPAQVVHNDYTLTAAPERIRMLTEPPKLNDTWRSLVPEGEPLISPHELDVRMGAGKRYALINVWRNIGDSPVEDMPLALCDGATLDKEDLITFEIRYSDRTGENYFARYSPEHKWIYFPKMVKDEAILLKVWDSAGTSLNEPSPDSTPADASAEVQPSDITSFSLHSAFKDPAASADCPRRESIEVRTVVFY